MWQGHIGQNTDNPIRSLYFDAFANVHQKDPFFALAAELYEMVIDEEEEKKENKNILVLINTDDFKNYGIETDCLYLGDLENFISASLADKVANVRR